MTQPKIVDVIIAYIESFHLPDRVAIVLASHSFEVDLPLWAASYYGPGVVHTPASYARIWRMVKSHAADYNLAITNVTQRGDKEHKWRIEYVNMQSAASPVEEMPAVSATTPIL